MRKVPDAASADRALDVALRDEGGAWVLADPAYLLLREYLLRAWPNLLRQQCDDCP